jgi:polyisoprenoid-binding protein YceI
MPSSPIATGAPPALRTGRWILDAAHSSVEFRVAHRFGLVRVSGSFERYEGILDARDPDVATITLSVDPTSLDTGSARRDAHLRSDAFLGAERHPRLRFVSDEVALEEGRLTARGELHAAGHRVRVTADGTLQARDGRLEVTAAARVDQRTLGMTWSSLGMVRAPAELVVRGRLLRAED